MMAAVVMTKIEEDSCGDSPVSRFVFVFWMSILNFRHSIARTVVQLEKVATATIHLVLVCTLVRSTFYMCLAEPAFGCWMNSLIA